MAAVLAALAGASVLAQTSHHRALPFGDEVVTLQFNLSPFTEELYRLWDATAETTDPVEQERLLRIRWEDYGETVALQSLARFHTERGDLVQAYAHLYAVERIAKWYERAVTEEPTPASGQGRFLPPGPLMKRGFAEIEADLARAGTRLTASQRQAGVKLAAALIRNNPNCCRWP